MTFNIFSYNVSNLYMTVSSGNRIASLKRKQCSRKEMIKLNHEILLIHFIMKLLAIY